jgi:hypothetical protein
MMPIEPGQEYHVCSFFLDVICWLLGQCYNAFEFFGHSILLVGKWCWGFLYLNASKLGIFLPLDCGTIIGFASLWIPRPLFL